MYPRSMNTSIKTLVTTIVLGALVLPALASGPTSTAKSLMDNAYAKATKEKKNVMLIFHASWCGWCHKLDDMLESPKFKKTFESSYVITYVDVMENGPKKDLENAGGSELMAQYGGATAGLPFFVILSPTGEKVGDSFLPDKKNMGFPAEPQEVAGFMKLLKKTAPKMTDDQRTTVEAFLKTQNPATGAGH